MKTIRRFKFAQEELARCYYDEHTRTEHSGHFPCSQELQANPRFLLWSEVNLALHYCFNLMIIAQIESIL